MFVDINSNFHKINTLTFCSIVMFFSYVENTGISIKRLLEKALNSGIITVASKKKQQLIVKDESKLSFEETMKLTFSVYPSLFGERNHYGDIKNNDLKTLRILRDIRNSIVHPKGIEDVFVTLKQLEGKDINLPMISYIKALQNLVNTCAKKI